MLDVKRWKELNAMTHEQLAQVAKNLGLSWPAPLGIISIMNAEFKRDHQAAAANMDSWFGVNK